jgi:putative PIN family toxin of toxin-antitoxin system
MRKESNRPRLTIDTNTVVSGTISPGNFASHLMKEWEQDAFVWVETPQTFQELAEVLSREKFRVKYAISIDDTHEFLEAVVSGATFVTPLPLSQLPLHSRDKKDDKFLACAIAGNCDYLVTEDEDLLVLNGRPELGKIQIRTAYEFLKRTGHM